MAVTGRRAPAAAGRPPLAPRLVDRVVARQIRKRVNSGAFDGRGDRVRVARASRAVGIERRTEGGGEGHPAADPVPVRDLHRGLPRSRERELRAAPARGRPRFSDTIFGLGAGIFSLGYVIFGVPSNLMLERFGARRWLAAIMITWGVLSASMMFIEGAASFYILRFLLGVAEAGFFPGIVLYLTWWFPEADRARAMALFMTAISPRTSSAARSRAACWSSTASWAWTAGSGCSCARACPR